MKKLFAISALLFATQAVAQEVTFSELRLAYIQCEGAKDLAQKGGPAVTADQAAKCDKISKAYLDVVTKRDAQQRGSQIDGVAKKLP